jgi:hypothetical protein
MNGIFGHKTTPGIEKKAFSIGKKQTSWFYFE